MGEEPRAASTVPIECARPPIERPPRTRVIVRPGEAGITFIDPPLTWALLRRTALFRLAIPALFWTAFVGVGAASAVWPKSFLGWLAAFLAVLVFFEGRRLLRHKRFSTIIEVSHARLTLCLTPRRRIEIPISELGDIHASRPIRAGRLLGRNSSLIIAAWGRSFTVLADRDYPEVLWLARQLRVATGRPADHPSEPAGPSPPFRGDQPFRPDAATPRPDEFSDSANTPAAGPKAAKKTRGQFLLKEYNDLGCAPTLFLLASVVIGLFVTSGLVERLVICLQFGPNAYFRNGVRPIPHHGFFELNNGHQIADAYKVLFFVLLWCSLLAWAILSLLVAIGWNRLVDRLQRRRWRLRAERDSRDRIRRQTRQAGRQPGQR